MISDSLTSPSFRLNCRILSHSLCWSAALEHKPYPVLWNLIPPTGFINIVTSASFIVFRISSHVFFFTSVRDLRVFQMHSYGESPTSWHCCCAVTRSAWRWTIGANLNNTGSDSVPGSNSSSFFCFWNFFWTSERNLSMIYTCGSVNQFCAQKVKPWKSPVCCALLYQQRLVFKGFELAFKGFTFSEMAGAQY